jgi:hypothetical protein
MIHPLVIHFLALCFSLASCFCMPHPVALRRFCLLLLPLLLRLVLLLLRCVLRFFFSHPPLPSWLFRDRGVGSPLMLLIGCL